MLEMDDTLVRITVGWEMSDEESEELAQALDDAEIDAVIEPAPGRMGIPGVDLVALTIETPLGVLATLAFTVAGRHVWNTLTTMTRNRRGQRGPSGVADETLFSVQDTLNQIRLDLTPDDLADERLLTTGIATLDGIRSTGGPLVLRWDRSTAKWYVHTPGSTS